MNRILKGIVIVVAVLVVSLIINVICNINGITVDSTLSGAVASTCSVLLYYGWTKDEKSKED